MKKGDKLICKKYCNYENRTIFYTNKYYSINCVVNDNCILVSDDNNKFLWFTIEKHGNFKYLYEYFYTQEELRILKLESL